MKILIIGCGYVGKAMAHFWKKKGHIVTVTTRKAERIADLHSCADFVYHLHDKSLAQALNKQEVVLLCVAPDRFSDYASTYLETAEQLVSHLCSSIKQIIYTSSTSVYGDFNGETVFEETPPNSTSNHSKILLETEKTLLKASLSNINVCILRLGEIIGPLRSIEDRLKNLSSARLPGTGKNMTNISPLEDIIAALDFAINYSLKGIFNLCTDFHITRHEWYDQICKKNGLPPIEWDPSQNSLHGGNKIISSAKIKSMGFKFSDDALRRLQALEI